MKKFLLLMAWFGCLLVQSLSAQEIADIVKAYPRGKAIVVEYDLGADAEFVRLFVSLDGGATYRGPLQQVSGDVVDVKAGFGHSLVWDVLKEFDVDAFENNQVRFKLSMKMKERWPKETFVTLNVAYSFVPQGSMGFSVGQVRRVGWFVSLMSNGSLSGFHFDGDCDANGFLPDGHLMQYNGETSRTRLSVVAGGLMRVTQSLLVRMGVGYGNRTLRWQTTEGKWLRNTASSRQGIDLSAGVQWHKRGFVMSLEAVTTQFQYVECKIGLGYVY